MGASHLDTLMTIVGSQQFKVAANRDQIFNEKKIRRIVLNIENRALGILIRIMRAGHI
jgi:hypothetical protein